MLVSQINYEWISDSPWCQWAAQSAAHPWWGRGWGLHWPAAEEPDTICYNHSLCPQCQGEYLFLIQYHSDGGLKVQPWVWTLILGLWGWPVPGSHSMASTGPTAPGGCFLWTWHSLCSAGLQVPGNSSCYFIPLYKWISGCPERETELSLTQSSVLRSRLNICKNYWVGKGKLLVLITLKFLSVFLFVCFFFLSLFFV